MPHISHPAHIISFVDGPQCSALAPLLPPRRVVCFEHVSMARLFRRDTAPPLYSPSPPPLSLVLARRGKEVVGRGETRSWRASALIVHRRHVCVAKLSLARKRTIFFSGSSALPPTSHSSSSPREAYAGRTLLVSTALLFASVLFSARLSPLQSTPFIYFLFSVEKYFRLSSFSKYQFILVCLLLRLKICFQALSLYSIYFTVLFELNSELCVSFWRGYETFKATPEHFQPSNLSDAGCGRDGV